MYAHTAHVRAGSAENGLHGHGRSLMYRPKFGLKRRKGYHNANDPKPLLLVKTPCWSETIFKCLGLIIGMTRGTSAFRRYFFAFRKMRRFACKNYSSMSPATSVQAQGHEVTVCEIFRPAFSDEVSKCGRHGLQLLRAHGTLVLLARRLGGCTEGVKAKMRVDCEEDEAPADSARCSLDGFR